LAYAVTHRDARKSRSRFAQWQSITARLRAETTMAVGWIAERLAMGTRGYLNHLLCRRRKLGGE
jgi:hypothetical protein